MSDKKKKSKAFKYLPFAVMMLGSVILGFFLGELLFSGFEDDLSFGKILLLIVFFIVSIYAMAVVHIIVHEAGHLVFGKISGYKFSSFRILNIMLIKKDGKLKLKKLNITGTLGQCLMIPPEMKDGKIPIMLFNFGGVLMNVIVSVPFFVLYFIFPDIKILSALFIIFAIIGIVLAFANGVPMGSNIANDGRNALSASKSKEAMRAFYIQLKINEEFSKGIRCKDMPGEWFTLPTDEEMKNPIIAAIGVFSCDRLIDERRFSEAAERINHILKIESGIISIHRNMMKSELIYIELITENRKEVIDSMLTKEQQAYAKAMKAYPSTIRTQYAYHLLYENDIEKANQAKKKFENTAKTYPYKQDIQAERELIQIAENKKKNA